MRMRVTICTFFLWIALLLLQSAQAQLCQGSLGDPVVNITFGQGTGAGAPLKAAAIQYKYTSSSCPDDGYYTVASHISSCFNDTWQNLQHDHTGDNNGYFLLINGTYKPGDFYVDTIRSLCSNTTYQFAAWMLNMLKVTGKIAPNITFSIERTDGTVLQQYRTGNIPITSPAGWTQYGFFFTTGQEVPEIVLRMTDNAPGGQGNDIALDDITFRACGPSLSISIAAAGSDEAQYCIGADSSFRFNGSVSNATTPLAYQWQQTTDPAAGWSDIPLAGDLNYTPGFSGTTPAGKYYYRLTAAQPGNIANVGCRAVSNTNFIQASPLPVPNAQSNAPLCTGRDLQLAAQNAVQYQWAGPAGFTAPGSNAGVPAVTLANAGQYTVTVTDSNGCRNKDSVFVAIGQSPGASLHADTVICQQSSVHLSGSGNGSFRWSPGDGLSSITVADPLATPDSTTRYLLSVTNGHCIDTASVLITVLQKPAASAGPDKELFEGASVQLTGAVSGADVHFYWTPGTSISNTQDLQPEVNPLHDTTYTLHAVSGAGCGEASDAVFVRVYKKVNIPNSFSPNGDHINDTWRIDDLYTYPEADISVFNRYGQLVYHSMGYNHPWAGQLNSQPLPVGTYYYMIDLKNRTPKLSGWVMILK